MGLAKDAPKEAELILFKSLEMTFKTSGTLLFQGWDADSTQGVMSIVRPFHRSRVVKKFAVLPGDDLKRKIKEQIEASRDSAPRNAENRNRLGFSWPC